MMLFIYLIFTSYASDLAKLERNVKRILAENKELLESNRRYRAALECGKTEDDPCAPETPNEPQIVIESCTNGNTTDIISDFAVNNDGTFLVTVEIQKSWNLYVGLYLNDELITYADERSIEFLKSQNEVSASLSWIGKLTTEDKISVKQIEDCYENKDGELDSELFSSIDCDAFTFAAIELTANSY